MAAVAENLNDETTQEYIKPENINNMAKVTLEAATEDDLKKVQQKLEQNNIKFKLWVCVIVQF